MSLRSVLPYLSGDVASEVARLLDVWEAKRARNATRTVYFDHKNPLEDLGISIPPQLQKVETQLGWPSKAVYGLVDRSNFDGFVLPGVDDDPLGLTSVLEANHFDVDLPQAQVSSLVHSVSFVTITHGDVQSGEPDVLLLARDAESAAGIWDPRRRSLRSGLSIMETDDRGAATAAALYLPGLVVEFHGRGQSRWEVREIRTGVNRALMEPLVFRPELRRPLGHSRISRPVMSLTDKAIRTALRSEVSAEFFSAPQRYLLGADEDAFTDAEGKPLPKWSALLGRFLAIGANEDGDIPQVGQFTQQSMQPHGDQMRQWGMLFSGETGIPLSDLGIAQDSNPASAEAIYASKEPLVIMAQNANRGWGATLSRIGQTAVMLRDGLADPTPESLRLQSKWRNPATPSMVSAADAVAKQISVLPWMAGSPVALEQMQFDAPTITRLLADRDKSAGLAAVERLIAAGNVPSVTSGDAPPEYAVAKPEMGGR